MESFVVAFILAVLVDAQAVCFSAYIGALMHVMIESHVVHFQSDALIYLDR